MACGRAVLISAVVLISPVWCQHQEYQTENMDDIEDIKLDISDLRRDVREQKQDLRVQFDCYLAEKRCGKIVNILAFIFLILWLSACTAITVLLLTRENIPVGSIMAWIPGEIPPEGDQDFIIIIRRINSYLCSFHSWKL